MKKCIRPFRAGQSLWTLRLAMYLCLFPGMMLAADEDAPRFGPHPLPNAEPWAYLRYTSILDKQWLNDAKIDYEIRHAASLNEVSTEENANEILGGLDGIPLPDLAPAMPKTEELFSDAPELFSDTMKTDEEETMATHLADLLDIFSPETIPEELTPVTTNEVEKTETPETLLSTELPEVEDTTDAFPQDTDVLNTEDAADTENARNTENTKDVLDTDKPAETENTEDTENTEEESEQTVAEAVVTAAEPPPLPAGLTPEEEILAMRLQRTLAVYHEICMATDENRPADIMMFAIPFGCKVNIYEGMRESEQRINAIAALCWNYPMHGQLTFNPYGDRLLPNLGYGVQRYPGQLLATFALSRVSADYRFPARSAKTDDFLTSQTRHSDDAPPTETSPVTTEKRTSQVFSIRDLVEYEQKRCREKADMSYALIGLSYYLAPDTVWEDCDGELWWLEKMLYHELKRRPSVGTSEITNQLFGITCALRCRQLRVKEETSTIYLTAEKYLANFRHYALNNQNEWHCWHPRFFEMTGISHHQRDEMFFATAHILRWLVMDTPRDELSDERIYRAMDVLERFAYDHLSRWDPGKASTKEIEAVAVALHAMMIYSRRHLEPKMASDKTSPD